MTELPRGTVTFLFTDIEGSTKLAQELGDRFTEVLVEHRRALRDVWARHHGYEVGTEGDSFFIAFASATDAAKAALEGQRALARGAVKVRMGMHTGEADVIDDNYVGIEVHRAARVSATAHGGQVVISERTKGLLGSDAPVTDLGLHRLKDLTAPEKLFQLGPGEFPPLRSLNATNLPTQPTPLIGRQKEIEGITALYETKRVVTLTGPGGTGKTRLSLQAGAELVDRFKDGVFWVPLAAVRESEMVLPTISTVLGTETSLTEHIGEKRMLLVLDNFEQITSAAPAVAELLAKTPNLHLLVTSRAPLRIQGESEYPVDPLPSDDAVKLFRERAANAEPESVVAEICRRVDNLPLAIELAAARTRLFTPTQLLDRLAQRLPMLTGGRRDLPERQRTLRATIEWSHELLDADAQSLFARLGVFSGSFDLSAAEAVADASLEDVERLVEESLVRQREGELSMLETIRDYALERLAATGDEPALRERHARYYRELAERAAPEMESEKVGEWIRRLTADMDNLRAAIAWTVDTGSTVDALRLCIALTDLWDANGQMEEGLRWFDRALGDTSDVPPDCLALALRESGGLLNFHNRVTEAIPRLEHSVALWREIGDESGLAGSLRALGSALVGFDSDAAVPVLEEALEIAKRTGDRNGERRVLHLLGELLRDRGDFEDGAALLERSIAIAHEIGGVMFVGGSTHSLADLELDRGNLDRAETHYRDSLRNAEELSLERHKVYCLAGLAAVAAGRGDEQRAATLWHAVEHAEDVLGFRLLGHERERYERRLTNVAAASEAALALEDAVSLALA